MFMDFQHCCFLQMYKQLRWSKQLRSKSIFQKHLCNLGMVFKQKSKVEKVKAERESRQIV